MTSSTILLAVIVARAIVCINVYAFSGLSRYRQDRHFTSKPVSHFQFLRLLL